MLVGKDIESYEERRKKKERKKSRFLSEKRNIATEEDKNLLLILPQNSVTLRDAQFDTVYRALMLSHS